jgi:hypothetical protein
MKSLFVLTSLLILFSVSGCIQMYPKWMDTPEGQAQVLNAFNRSQLQGAGQVQIDEPGLRIIAGYTLEVRAAGVHGAGQIQVGTPPSRFDSVITGKDILETTIPTSQPAKTEPAAELK